MEMTVSMALEESSAVKFKDFVGTPLRILTRCDVREPIVGTAVTEKLNFFESSFVFLS